MKKIMLINAVEAEEHRIAFVSDDMLEGFHIDTASAEQKEGNIYKGIVERIEPSLQSCFVNFGSVKNGFLPMDSIHPEYYNDSVEINKDQPVPPDSEGDNKRAGTPCGGCKGDAGKEGRSIDHLYLTCRQIYRIDARPDNKRSFQKDRQ